MSRRGHPRFFELTREMDIIHEAKNTGYATQEDPLSNFKMCEHFNCPNCGMKIPAWLGALIRMSDKWSRLIQLVNNPNADKVGETIADTLGDLAGYDLVVRILREEWENERK